MDLYDITDICYFARDLANANSKILSILDRLYKFQLIEKDIALQDEKVIMAKLDQDLVRLSGKNKDLQDYIIYNRSN